MLNMLHAKKTKPACTGFKLMKSAVPAFALLLSACVSDTGTGALSGTQIQEKQSSHEQRHVATKCTSADRLKSSNLASSALNNKFTAYGAAEANLSAERKSAIVAELQSNGAQLESLDKNLNTQCIAYSACEYHSSINKQSCEVEKHKFLDTEKQVVSFARKIDSIRIN